ncbi:chlamydia polymorphic membrane middle domain protein, partial [Chlamydia psittaci 84-8471/1]
LGISS